MLFLNVFQNKENKMNRKMWCYMSERIRINKIEIIKNQNRYKKIYLWGKIKNVSTRKDCFDTETKMNSLIRLPW